MAHVWKQKRWTVDNGESVSTLVHEHTGSLFRRRSLSSKDPWRISAKWTQLIDVLNADAWETPETYPSLGITLSCPGAFPRLWWLRQGGSQG